MRRFITAVSISLVLNLVALAAISIPSTPDLAQGGAYLFLLPGEACSIFFGANMISGPDWAWAATNALLLSLLLYALLSLGNRHPSGRHSSAVERS